MTMLTAMHSITTTSLQRMMRPSPNLESNQLRHRPPAIHQVLRTTREIINSRLGGVDAEELVERGEDLAEVHGALCGFTAKLIGLAYHLAGLEAAAGEQSIAHARPVIAAALLV